MKSGELSGEVIIKENINYVYWSKRQKPQSGLENINGGFIEMPVLVFLFCSGGTKDTRVVKKNYTFLFAMKTVIIKASLSYASFNHVGQLPSNYVIVNKVRRISTSKGIK